MYSRGSLIVSEFLTCMQIPRVHVSNKLRLSPANPSINLILSPALRSQMLGGKVVCFFSSHARSHVSDELLGGPRPYPRGYVAVSFSCLPSFPEIAP